MKRKPPNTASSGETKRARRYGSQYGQRYDFEPGRTLTPEEHALWLRVTADAALIPQLATNGAKSMQELLQEPEKTIPGQQRTSQLVTPAMLSPALPPRAGVRASPPPLTQMDSRTAKRLGRGQLTPQARLDLHGFTRHTAEPALLRFVTDARARGCKLVLVITGKGAPGHLLHSRDFHADPTTRSVLRELVPGLLAEPQFRTHVASFQPAHPKHGGGGALYLWLRRTK